jgi:hypothetical protein
MAATIRPATNATAFSSVIPFVSTRWLGSMPVLAVPYVDTTEDRAECELPAGYLPPVAPGEVERERPQVPETELQRERERECDEGMAGRAAATSRSRGGRGPKRAGR